MRPRRADELIGGNPLLDRQAPAGRLQSDPPDRRPRRRPDRHRLLGRTVSASRRLHRRAHQGWRYLEDEDAPSADDDGTGLAGLPPQLYGRLAALALV
jgi:hypothetical protein